MSNNENHGHEEHVDEVMGMKQGHGKVPRFLIVVYVILAIWAVTYALTAKGIDDRPAGGQTAAQGVSAEVGKGLTSACAACHGADLKGGLGPNLHGVVGKLKEDGVMKILENGKGGMPAMAKNSGWTTDQTKSVIAYLKTLN
ncbi:c-type cytochrome [Aneurinibacillus terranovensis]|uniref:c-type cytochrome n=1 Tax=Aneurinibacillus terranovensis TaxID=278991 RepID=UPI00041EBFBD|nr:cytochrome c [Aneurinibacillus terranovensis]